MRISKFEPAFVLLATTSLTQTAYAQTIATPLNVNAINLLNPFSTPSGSTVIQQNLTSVADEHGAVGRSIGEEILRLARDLEYAGHQRCAGARRRVQHP